MLNEKSPTQVFVLRTILAAAMILFAAVLRVVPHPWNFTPIGAMALFSGAVLKDRRLAFLFPLAALFAGDLFIGFHRLIPEVYASFLLSVLIGRIYLWNGYREGAASAVPLRPQETWALAPGAPSSSSVPTEKLHRGKSFNRRSVPRIGLAVFLGALQFFLITNLAIWKMFDTYPHTPTGLAACYIAGLPFFGNTLAGDAIYATVFFGMFALAEHFFPSLRLGPSPARA